MLVSGSVDCTIRVWSREEATQTNIINMQEHNIIYNIMISKTTTQSHIVLQLLIYGKMPRNARDQGN